MEEEDVVEDITRHGISFSTVKAEDVGFDPETQHEKKTKKIVNDFFEILKSNPATAELAQDDKEHVKFFSYHQGLQVPP